MDSSGQSRRHILFHLPLIDTLIPFLLHVKLAILRVTCLSRVSRLARGKREVTDHSEKCVGGGHTKSVKLLCLPFFCVGCQASCVHSPLAESEEMEESVITLWK